MCSCIIRAMLYKYETHLHTKEASACASSQGKEYISVYKRLGYSGIFVTDHFFGGNTCIDRNLSWEERIELYCSGYENALREAEAQNKADGGDFKVFFGIEQTFDGDDYLIYGLDKSWLLSHREVEAMRHKELFDAVNSVGGLMIQAHPFRLRGYIDAIHLNPRYVHGVETYNGGNNKKENLLAELYAQFYDFPVTSGSDIHNISFALEENEDGETKLGGMAFETPLESVADYCARVKGRKQSLV